MTHRINPFDRTKEVVVQNKMHINRIFGIILANDTIFVQPTRNSYCKLNDQWKLFVSPKKNYKLNDVIKWKSEKK